MSSKIHPRVQMAYNAMKEIGIPQNTVKPVLKNLLKLYDKNWQLIEDENYRALADAIFEYKEEHKESDDDENQKKKKKKKEVVESHEDSEPPRLKRLRQDDQYSPPLVRRQRGQDDQHSPPLVRRQMGPNFDLTPREEAVPLNICVPGRNEHLSLPYVDFSGEETEETPTQLQLRRKRNEHGQSVSPRIDFENRLKGPLLAPTICERSERQVPAARFVVCLKEPKTEPGIEPLVPKEKVASGAPTNVSIKPKAKPCSDAFQPLKVPVSVMQPASNPDCRRAQDPVHKDQNVSNGHHGVEALPSQGFSNGHHGVEALPSLGADVESGSPGGSGTSSENVGGLQLADVPEATRASVELGSSNSGEVKISLTCNYASGQPNFRLPSMDEVYKMVEDKCLKSYKIINPSFSLKNLMTEVCQYISEQASNSTDDNQEPLMHITANPNMSDHEDSFQIPPTTLNGSANSHASTEVVEASQLQVLDGVDDLHCTVIQPNEEVLVVEQAEVGYSSQEISTPDGTRSIDNALVVRRPFHDVDDISKGQENFPITAVNEVNSAPYPPLFYYISKNTIFRSAHVNCSLSRIGDENCCSNCFGDCVSSFIPCACASVSGGDFAYTLEGLLKESFLEECISMNRDPQNYLFYCKSCPLERCKDGDSSDPCKGHLMRKFIKECWSKCGCNKQCGNRVVQRGISCNLQVFLTAEGKGWGLRTLTDLPRGSFVCEYVGEILTSKELYERNKEITNVDIQSSNVLLDAAWGSDGVVKDKDALCLDATFYGNVARFINHRCFDANLVEVPVEVESPNHRYYHLAFFTTRDVQAFEELTWDYGIDFTNCMDTTMGFRCFCGSKECRDVKRRYI